MHIWDDKPSSVMHEKTFSKKMDYSNCPLKKRPVNLGKILREEMEYDNTDDYAEPENLSTKPQDLSVKCKPENAAVSASAFDSKKDLPASHTTPHNNNNNYQHAAAVPPPSPYHSNHQQPYQPTPVKPGPLEPLCLNISGDHHPGIIPSSITSAAAAASYHHHRRQYAPAVPRPVPAQYPGTGYLAGYIYHHGGLTAERGYPVVTPGPVYRPQTVIAGTTARDMSLSPPGSGGTGSAFKPLHAIPSSGVTVITSATCSPPSMTWYAPGGWSTADMDVSPPLPITLSSTSSSPSAVSPPYGPHPAASPAYGPPSAVSPAYGPPPAVPYTHCSGESDASSTAAEYKRKPVVTAARYKCPSCTKTYSTMAGLTKHQQHHLSDDECAAAAAAAKTFCCKFCDKAYNTLGALKMHIRTHTLPCICNLCGKAFSRPWLLQGHIRTHTGEKPFSCQHCNRAFADRSNLRAHLQTHSDVKKYSCLTCSKTFSRMSLLTKHSDAGCQGVQQQLQQQQPQPSQQQPPQLLQQQPQMLHQQPQMLHQQPQMLHQQPQMLQ